MSEQQIWDLWIPDVGSQGLSFARGRCDETETLLVHAAPRHLSVDVWTDQGRLLARGRNLARTDETPMAKLQRRGNQIIRQEIWPTQAEYGLPVILAGGEIGILRAWWNDPGKQEWRWSIELYNHR
jgi:hypothetical protein